jgi:hypothetical protein
MFKRFIKTRSVLVIFSLAVVVAVPVQTTQADAASCAESVAAAASAQSTMQQTCQFYGSGSGSCASTRAAYYNMLAVVDNQCQ